MASSTKLVCFFFLITTLLSSLQTHARDSQFFSKVSRNRDETAIPTNNLNKNQENDASLFGKPQEQEEQPVFDPETSESAGYGLFGHETGLDAPSTTTTTTTATPVTATPSSSLYNMDDQNLYFDNTNKNEKFENSQVGKNYVPELTGLSETSYTNDVAQNRYNNNNNFNDKYENFGNNKKEKSYVPELAGLSETSYTNDVVPKKYVAQNRYDNSNNYLNNNNNNYENNQEEKRNYVPELTGLSESSYENEMVPSKYVDENKYKNMYSSNNFNNKHNNFNNKNNNGDEAKYYSGSTGYNGGGVEKQGMSDTRYLENGKYYYDIEAEKKLNPYNYDMTYSNNRFNNNNNNNNVFRNNNNNYNNNNNGQLYGNRENSREEYFNSYNTKYNNNNNSNNGMYMQQGYKNNQFPEEGEFDFDDQP